jgi:hypothetical protein
MINFESVLAFGDSNVAGCELAGGLEKFRTRAYKTGKVLIEEVDAPGKLFAFPQMVADHFNIPCYNYAMTGSSNDRNLRLLSQAVQEHPNSLVLFGYTWTDRTEFYYPEGGIGCDRDNFFQAGPDNFDTHMNRKYLEILHPYDNLKTIMFLVDSVCRIHAKYFLHLPLLNHKNLDIIPDVTNLIDFGTSNNYENWAIENNFSRYEIHFGVDAHRAISEKIIQKIYRDNK